MEVIQKMFEASSVKAALIILFTTIWQFLMPIGDFIILISILLIADFITGVMAAKKRGEKITSKGWRRTVVKIGVYALAIILTQYLKVTFIKDWDINLARSVALFIVTIETKSIDENFEELTGISLLTKILTKISKPIKK
jgi:phage-related holin